MNKKGMKALIISICVLVLSICSLAGVLLFNPSKDNTNNTTVETPSTGGESGEVLPSIDWTEVYFASETEETGSLNAPDDMKGGAVYLEPGAKFELSRGTIENHEGYFGGAVYISNGATFTMNGGSIDYNYSMYGGAIYIEDGGKCYINGGSISNNAAQNAPAIYVENGGELYVDGETVTLNANEYIAYETIEVNYYVNGILDTTAVQSAAVLNMSKAPLSYEECNGYFLDEELTESVERGELLLEYSPVQTATQASASTKSINLYTRKATPEQFTYTVFEEEYYKISGWTATGNVCVPRMYNGKKVVGINDYGCDHNSNITAIYLPATIKNIANGAFEGDTSLAYINLTDELETIGSYSFSNSKFTTINIPKSLTTIGDNAFYISTSLTTLNIPENSQLLSIGNNCFSNCALSGDLVLPSSVESIGTQAFQGTSITSADLSNTTITTIKESTFMGCTSLTSLLLPETIEAMESACVQFCPIESLVLPASVTNISTAFYMSFVNIIDMSATQVKTISENAFSDSHLSQIMLPETLETIESNAFGLCGQLLTISNLENTKITSLYPNTFNGCSALKNITLPETLNSFAYGVFSDCSSLESINMPSNVTTISENVFSGCSSLKSITIPEKIESLGSYFLRDTSSLENIYFNSNAIANQDTFCQIFSLTGKSTGCNLIIGNNVTKIPNGIFSNPADSGLTHNISSVTFEENSTCEEIGTCAFSYASNIKSVTIPNSVKTINEQAFYYCSALSSVNLSSGVEKIDLWAFEGCSSLVNVDWSNATSLTTLGEAVFRACVNLESITLPNSVDGYLPDMLFLGCASLKTFNFPTSVDAIGYNTFNGCTSITEMNIPSGVTRIASSPFEGCTSLKTLTIPDTVEKLYFDINNGCAALETINFNATNCSFYNTTDSAYFAPIFVNDSNFIVNFGNNVQKIPECMFDSNTKIKSLNLPSSIIEIGINAFKGCTGLTTITIPTNVTNIGEYAFAECVNVNTLNFNATACGSFKNTGYVFEKLGLNVGTTVNIGANVQKIPDYFLHYNTNTPNVQTVNFADSSACTVIGGFAFYKTSFSSVNLPDSLKTIGSNAFEASGISSVSIPSALEFIGDDAFKDCVLLSTVSNFGNSSVQLIRGFYGCYNLSSITLPSNAISIEENAFRDCSSIETINIPNSIITISNHAFDGCSALTSFDIPESVSALGEYILNNTTSLLRINYNSQHFYEESFEECYVFAGAGATSGCSLNVGSSVRCIPDYMFSYSYGENYISSVSFSNYSDCYYIGEHAFYACESLKEIEIPENLYNIGYEAFAYCVNLETINYEAYALGYNEDEGSIIFLEDACAFYDAGSSTDGGITINFANSVALVPRFLFGIYGNYGGPCITNINFSQVEGENCIIDMYAFYGQTNLTSITLSNNVCRIYEGAFTLCENVEYCSFSSFDCIRDDKIDWIIYQDVGEFTSNSPNDSRTFDHDSEEEYLTSCFEFFHEFLSPEDYVCSYFTLYGYDYDDNIGFYLI